MSTKYSNNAIFYCLYNDKKLKRNQQIMRMLITPYNDRKFLLSTHETGWGKSYTMAVIAYDFIIAGWKVFVVTKGITAENNFKIQVENIKLLLSESNARLMNNIKYKHNLSLDNEVNALNSSSIVDRYNKSIFMIDEIHNMKTEDHIDVDNLDDFDNYKKSSRAMFNIISICNNIKVICASATPILNSRDEMIYIKDMYKSLYKTANDPLFNEYVSFSKVDYEKPKLVYAGEDYNGLNVVRLVMEGEQRKKYEKNMSSKIFGENTSNSLAIIPEDIDINSIYSCGGDDLINKGMLINEYLLPSNIKNISIKYSYILDVLKNTRGSVFIYCDMVNGIGIKLLRAVLEANGYSYYKNENLDEMSPGNRYTSTYDKDKYQKEKIIAYNSNINKGGKYIRVFIGSKVVCESVSLQNTSTIILATLCWNIGTEDQIIGRSIRRTSDIANNNTITVHRLVSCLDYDLNSYSNMHCLDVETVNKMIMKKDSMSDIAESITTTSIESTISNSYDIDKLDYSDLYRYNMSEIINVKYNDIWKHMIHVGICHVKDMLYIFDNNIHVLIESILMIIRCNMFVRYFYNKCLYLRRYGDIIHIVDDPSKDFDCRPCCSSFILGQKENIDTDDAILEYSGELPDIEYMKHMSIIDVIDMCRKNGIEYARSLFRYSVDNHLHNILDIFKFCISNINGNIYTVLYAKDESSYTTQYISCINNDLIMKYSNYMLYKVEDKYCERILYDIHDKIENVTKDLNFYAFVSIYDWKLRLVLKDVNKDAEDKRLRMRGKICTTYNKADLRYIIDKYIKTLKHNIYISITDSNDTISKAIENVCYLNNILFIY